jgi:hypothetical protein
MHSPSHCIATDHARSKTIKPMQNFGSLAQAVSNTGSCPPSGCQRQCSPKRRTTPDIRCGSFTLNASRENLRSRMKTFYNLKTTITDHRSVLQKSHQLHDLSHNTVHLHSLQYRRYIGLVLLLSQGQRLQSPINHHKGYFIHELRCDITILVPFPGVLLRMRTPSSTYQAALAH